MTNPDEDAYFENELEDAQCAHFCDWCEETVFAQVIAKKCI